MNTDTESTPSLTPEQLVESCSLYLQIDSDSLLNLAYTVLSQNPLATPDNQDYYACQYIGDR